jgi:AhpD family alkylhydroperoxidase
LAEDWLALERDHTARSRTLMKDGGEPLRAFRTLAGAVGKDGALAHKHKELIALAIAVAVRCEGCIVFHTRSCVRLGVSREELIEMLGVAVEMGGGPSVVYGAQALECFDAMSKG